MKTSKRLAACSLMAALSVIMMLLGAILDIGTYAAPMLASLCLIPIGKKYGAKYQVMVWLIASLLAFLLIPNPEQNLMYFGLFGWYPILRPVLQRLPKLLRFAVKFLSLNAVMIGIEALVMLVLVPETMQSGWLIAFALLMNVLFICYDILLPRMELVLRRVTEFL